MIRVLCIFALVVVAIFGQDDMKKKVSLTDFYETCKKPFITENYNPNWESDQGVNENSTLYFPLLSKGDMFRLAQQLFKTPDFEEFKEEHLTNTCIRLQRDVTKTVLTMKGYDDKTFVKYLNPIIAAPNSYYFPPVFSPSYGGRVYISLSDNKSFTVWVLCNDDGLGSFAVTSPQKTLPSETLAIAKEHLKALGFKEEHFLEPNYDLDCESPLEDVPVAKNMTVPLFLSNVLLLPQRFYPNALFAVRK